MMVKARFVSFVVVGCLELFLYAWPAENLMETVSSVLILNFRFIFLNSQLDGRKYS